MKQRFQTDIEGINVVDSLTLRFKLQIPHLFNVYVLIDLLLNNIFSIYQLC